MTHEPWNLCPMCETPMNIDERRDDRFNIVEYEHRCPNGDYLEKCAYGHHRVVIGDREWTWNRQTTGRDFRRTQEEIQDVIATEVIRANREARR